MLFWNNLNNLPEKKSKKENKDNSVEDESKNSGCTGNSDSGSLGSKDGSENLVGQLVNNTRGENQEEETSNQSTKPFLRIREFKVQQILKIQISFDGRHFLFLKEKKILRKLFYFFYNYRLK